MLNGSATAPAKREKRTRPAKGELGERRCIVTRASAPRGGLLRFVVSPEGKIVPDLAERLPGRGLWVSADRATVEIARAKNLFARAAGGPAVAAADLAAQIERQLAERACAFIGLARRAGQLIAGRSRVREAIGCGGVAVVITARDADPLDRVAHPGLHGPIGHFAVLTEAEIGAAVGRDSIAHVGIAPGQLAEKLMHELTRLAGFRASAELSAMAQPKQSASGAHKSNARKNRAHG